MISLSPAEKHLLAQYDSKETLLCVKSDERGSYLSSLQRADLHCFNLFLRFFGWGKLAHCTYNLTSVTHYLEGKNLQEYKAYRLGDEAKKIQKTLHVLADKVLLHKKQPQLPLLLTQLACRTFTLNLYVLGTKGAPTKFLKPTIHIRPYATLTDLLAQAKFSAGLEDVNHTIRGRDTKAYPIDRIDEFTDDFLNNFLIVQLKPRDPH